MKPSRLYQKPIIPSSFERWWLQFYENKLAFSALIILGIFVLVAIFFHVSSMVQGYH